MGSTDGFFWLPVGVHHFSPSLSQHLQRPTPVPSDLSRRRFLEEEILALLHKEAIFPLPPSSDQGFSSVFFLAPKKTGDWHPIINLRPLNAFIQPKHFRMETLAVVLQTLSQGWWTTSLDLKDAYLHIPVHRDHQKFLQFIYQDTTFQFRRLPFGPSTAPQVFTRVTKVVAAALRRQQIHLYIYLDDWLIVGPTRHSTLEALKKTIQLTSDLGFIINTEKSSLIPTRRPTFLGASLNTVTGRASPTLERCITLEECVLLFLVSTSLPAQGWLRLLGIMASLVDIVPWCRMRMRPIQLHLLHHYRPRSDPVTKQVPVSSFIQTHLRWWLSHENLLLGTTFPRPSPTVTLTSDGLGCSPERSNVIRNLVPIRKSSSHQSLRTTCCLQSPPISAQSGEGLTSSDQDRQFYSGVLLESSGSNSFPLPLSPNLETPQLVHSSTYSPSSHPPSGEQECHCRRLFTGTISPHRMDSPSPNITTSIQYPGHCPHKSLCITSQQSAAGLTHRPWQQMPSTSTGRTYWVTPFPQYLC